jgi:hypothetical protein
MGLSNYREQKKCKSCGQDFVEQSASGNPYKFCKYCRVKKWYRILDLAIQIKRGEK